MRYQKSNLKIKYNHWFDQKEFKKDYYYLEIFFWNTCSDLKKSLNKFHNLNLSTKTWSILLFPWLYEYTSVVYDRWLEVSNQKTKKKFRFKKKNLYLKESNNFFYLSQNKNWNNFLYYKIQNFLSNNCYNEKNTLIKKNPPFFYKIFQFFFFISKTMSLFIIGKKNIYVDNNPFESKRGLKTFYNFIIIKLIKKTNRILNNFYDYDISERLKFKKVVKKTIRIKKNPFEKFFFENISFDLPCEILEGLKIHIKNRIKIPSCKNIYSTYSHFDNFNFKICFAELIQNNCKINVLEHGGGLPHRGINFDFEEKIYSKKYVWFKKHNLNQKQYLHKTLKYEYYNIRHNSESINNKAIVITTLYPKYFSKMSFTRHNFNYFHGFLILNKFINKLSKTKQNKIYLKAHPGSNKQYYLDPTLDLLKNNKHLKIINKKENFKKVLKENKLIICTSPETTFTLSMLSGAPTILLFNMKNISMHQKVKKIFKDLIKVKILFIDPIKAAKHFESIIDDPQIWYNSREVKEVRKKFLKNAFNVAL